MKHWSLRHVSPELQVFAGERAVEQLARQFASRGTDRVVVVTGRPIVRQSTAIADLEQQLGSCVVARFEEAREHSPLPSVLAARDLIRKVDAQAVVAVGGGSAVVTARAAIVLAAEDANVRDLSTHPDADGRLVSPRLVAPKIPLWVVPSTPTTAYAKAGAAVRDPESGERLALFDPKARATGIVLDPQVALTAPVSLVRSSALNAFSMCIDGLQASTDLLADASLLHALRGIATTLPAVLASPDDARARMDLMLFALLAGRGSDHVGTGLAQPISHALGRHSGVGNGVLEASLFPHTMRYNAGATDAAMIEIARALDPRAEASVETAIGAVATWLESVGCPVRLRDTGLDEADLVGVADHVGQDWSSTQVARPALSVELDMLLERAW